MLILSVDFLHSAKSGQCTGNESVIQVDDKDSEVESSRQETGNPGLSEYMLS